VHTSHIDLNHHRPRKGELEGEEEIFNQDEDDGLDSRVKMVSPDV
jgi:hypothetical protein